MKIEHDPAFPVTVDETTYFGLSVRDYFAAKALNAILLQDDVGVQAYSPFSSMMGGKEAGTFWAETAYGIADAMLKAREK